MGLSFSARRRSCWLLLIAFLYASLVPALGLASGKPSIARTVWVQLCNSATHEFVAVDLTDKSTQGDKPSVSRATGHCLLCHSPSLLPTTETPNVAVVLVRYLRLVVADDDPAPRAAPVWNVSLARAPPGAA